MSTPLYEQLIQTSILLASSDDPSQANLRRAVSTAYYAIFHRLAECCAEMLVGNPTTNLTRDVWSHAYRGLEHGTAKNQCDGDLEKRGFSYKITQIASQFVRLQARRHIADYDPYGQFTKSDVDGDVFMAAVSIDMFDSVDEEEQRAFAAWILLRPRRKG